MSNPVSEATDHIRSSICGCHILMHPKDQEAETLSWGDHIILLWPQKVQLEHKGRGEGEEGR